MDYSSAQAVAVDNEETSIGPEQVLKYLEDDNLVLE